MKSKILSLKKSLPVFLALAFLILFLFLLIVWNISSMLSDRSMYAIEKELFDQSLVRMQYLQSIADQDEVTRAALEQGERRLPKGLNQDEIFNTLYALCLEKGTTAAQIDFETAVVDETGMTALPMRLSARGNYRQVMSLLEALSYDGRLILIHELSLNDDSAGKGDVAAEVNTTVYYR